MTSGGCLAVRVRRRARAVRESVSVPCSFSRQSDAILPRFGACSLVSGSRIILSEVYCVFKTVSGSPLVYHEINLGINESAFFLTMRSVLHVVTITCKSCSTDIFLCVSWVLTQHAGLPSQLVAALCGVGSGVLFLFLLPWQHYSGVL